MYIFFFKKKNYIVNWIAMTRNSIYIIILNLKKKIYIYILALEVLIIMRMRISIPPGEM